METPKEKLCECHTQPITIKTMDNGFNIPDGDRTYFKFPDGVVVQFICRTTGEPCSVVQEATNEPMLKKTLQRILGKERVTRKDLQGYLAMKGWVKVNDLGWVLQEKLGEMVMKGIVKQIDGMYILTKDGIDRYTLSSIHRFLVGKTNVLDIQALSKSVENKRKDNKMIKKIFEGMTDDE